MSKQPEKKKFTITQNHIQTYKTKLDACYAEMTKIMKEQDDPVEDAKHWKKRLDKNGATAFEKILDPKGPKLSSTQITPSKTRIVVDVPINKQCDFMLDTTKCKLYDSYYNGTQQFADLTKYFTYEGECRAKLSDDEVVTQTRLLHMKYKGFLVVGPRDFFYVNSFKKLDAKTIIVATVSVDHEQFAEFKGHTRGVMGFSGVILQAVSDTQTSITNVADIDLKGWIPKEAVKTFTSAEEYNTLQRIKKASEGWFKNQPVPEAPEIAAATPIESPQDEKAAEEEAAKKLAALNLNAQQQQ